MVQRKHSKISTTQTFERQIHDSNVKLFPLTHLIADNIALIIRQSEFENLGHMRKAKLF